MGWDCSSDNIMSGLVEVCNEAFQSCTVIGPARVESCSDKGQSFQGSALWTCMTAMAVKSVEAETTVVLQVPSNSMPPPSTLYGFCSF